MDTYHKIQTLFKREPDGKRRIIVGEWTLPEFEYLAGNMWQFTEKIDGTNVRVMWKDGDFCFAGKTDAANLPLPLLARLIEKFIPLKSRMVEHFAENEVCLYGEGYGAKIQNGGKYRQDQDFILFDVRVGRWWLTREGVEAIGQQLDLETTPLVGEGTLYEAINLVKGGLLSRWGNFEAEGIVMRPKIELTSRNGSRIIAKLKARDFS